MCFTPVANADSKSMALAASVKGVHHITTFQQPNLMMFHLKKGVMQSTLVLAVQGLRVIYATLID